MSDREFEHYLAILGGLLRLNSNRREEIAAELRDHLEERLAELLGQGVSRHQAIVTALEEFGDAAGLAGEFLVVVRRQRRRWYMKMTVGSVAVCVAICFTLLALWPDHHNAPGGPLAVAQETNDPFGPAEKEKTEDAQRSKKNARDSSEAPGGANPNKADVAPAEITPEANNSLTEKKLAKRIQVSFNQIPLSDVLANIAEIFEIDVFVSKKHLDNAGVGTDTPVDLNFKSISGDMLLDLILRGVGLNYAIQDGIVVVTTSDDLDSMLEVRVYNCRDVIGLARPVKMGGEQSAIPGMEGGAFGMSGMEGGMPGAGNDGGMMMGMGAAPRSRTKGRAAADPAAAQGMPGSTGSEGEAIGMAAPGGMAGMGASGGMGVGMPGGMPGMPMGGMGGGGSGYKSARVPDYDALINVLTYTVMPESWEAQGGPGTIEAYHGGLLIVNNNPQAHRKIDKLLKMIRDAGQQPPGSVVRER